MISPPVSIIPNYAETVNNSKASECVRIWGLNCLQTGEAFVSRRSFCYNRSGIFAVKSTKDNNYDDTGSEQSGHH